MVIPQDQAEKILSLTMQTVKEIATEAHKYIGTHKNIRGYSQYPILSNLIYRENPELEEIYKKIPWFIYDIPLYYLKDFPKDRIEYGAIFKGYSSDKIDVLKFESFKVLYQYIINSKEARSAFFEDEKKPNEYVIKNMISEIVERYLYITNADETIPVDLENKIKPFVNEKLLRYLLDSLEIDIYVPISLATFQDDSIELSNSIEIIRIPEEIQKARTKACHYESSQDANVASCATHMIVIHGYYFENDKYLSINKTMKWYTAYPLDVIDNIMAIIRVVTGYSIGYEQILSSPIDWIDSICEDLAPLYGATTPFVNPNEVKKDLFLLPINYINSEQAENIKTLYKTILDLQDDKAFSKILFALKRLNRCMLRNETDDMAIDATIGLEALLSGGTKGEITYTISNRIPIVFKYEEDEKYYKSNDCRKIMRQIYKYRSSVVHGSTLKDKDKVYKINDVDVPIEKIAVDFLRQTLLFILKNPEFVDAKKFDECIDNAVFNCNIEI